MNDSFGFGADTVDETFDPSTMQGPSSTVNQIAGQSSWKSSPTKSLVAMWFVVLAVYWLVGYLFNSSRA